jgi:putative transposase
MRRFEFDGRARFLTFSTYERLPLLRNSAIADRFVELLASAHLGGGFLLFAWVIMPEHVHLVIWPRDITVTKILIGPKRVLAREVIGRRRELEAPILDKLRDGRGRPHFWLAGGGYDRNIRDEDELREKVDYVHKNPVKRGLVVRPEYYPWSSARWYAGDRSGPLQIDHW